MLRLRIVAALILTAAAFQAPARDVSREQNAVEFARHGFEQADAEHKADLEQLARTRKAVERLQIQLRQDQKKASLSLKKKQQAQARLQKAEQALDRAWKQ